MKKPEFTPLPEIHHQRIKLNLALPPFINPEEIGIDLARTETLMNIGGVLGLAISSAHKGVTRSQPTIVGVGPNGEALAGKTGLADPKEVFSGESQSLRNGFFPRIPHGLNWAVASATINIDEVVDRVSKDKRWEKGTRDPAAWAFFINEAMKTTIARVGRHQLLSGASGWEKIVSGMIAFNTFGIDTLNAAPNIMEGSNNFVDFPIRASLWFIALSQFNNLVGYLYLLNENTRPFVRPSLFYAWQIDRALALWALGSVSTLAKAVK